MKLGWLRDDLTTTSFCYSRKVTKEPVALAMSAGLAIGGRRCHGPPASATAISNDRVEHHRSLNRKQSGDRLVVIICNGYQCRDQPSDPGIAAPTRELRALKVAQPLAIFGLPLARHAESNLALARLTTDKRMSDLLP